MKCVYCYSLSQIITQSLTDDFVILVSGFTLLAFCPTMELRVEQRSNIRLEEHVVTLQTVVLAVYLLVSVPDPKPIPVRCYTRSNICTSLVPRPRGRREKWPGIHCLRMHEKPHDFMGYRIPSFT